MSTMPSTSTTDGPPVPATVLEEAPPSPPPPPPHGAPRRSTGLVVLGLLAVGTGVTAALLLRNPPASAVEARPADVPHVENNGIVVSPTFRQRMGLETHPVARAPLTPLVRATGMTTFNPQQTAAVSTRIKGTLRRLVKVEGDVVRKGDILAEIESAELGTAQAALTVARAQFHAAESNATRETELAAKKLTTGRELELARAVLEEQRALRTAAQQRVEALGAEPDGPFGVYLVRAPLSGTVVERNLSVGQAVDGSEVLFRIANLDQLWVELQLFEPHVDQVRTGDVVELHPLSNPNETVRGRIAHVGEVVDLQTRSTGVRVELPNQQRKLRAGQAVLANILASGPTRTVLLVPKAAITLVDGQPTVFVEETATRFAPVTVRVGAADGRQQEVVEGLEEGDRVVVDGVFALKSELFR